MKNLFLLVIGFFLLSLNFVNAQDNITAAQKAIDNKDYKTGFNTIKELISQGNTTEASKLLIRIQASGYSDKALFELFGDCYDKQGVAELAIENYQAAENLDSMDVQLKFKSAEILYKQKRYTDAVNKYLKIISIEPNNPKAYVEAAEIFYAAKMYSDASLMYEKYIALEQTKEAYQSITNALLVTKNYEKTFQFGSEGAAKYPEDATIAKNTAIAAYAQKKYNEAAKFYAVVPDTILSTSDIVNAARSFQQIKSDSLALKYFEIAVKRDSTLASIYMDLGNYNYLNKNYDAAVKYYMARVKSDSTFEPAYRFMAYALMQQQKREDTRWALLKSIALVDTGTESIKARYWLVQTYRQMDSTSAAADMYQKMLDAIGNNDSKFKNECAEAYGFLGQRAFERKNYGGAVGYLRRAVTLKGDLGYKVMLATALHQSGSIDEAIEWYRRVLKADPKNEVAKKGLRMLSAD
jgi:tetratricopeptide (TPR) repeat protein